MTAPGPLRDDNRRERLRFKHVTRSRWHGSPRTGEPVPGATADHQERARSGRGARLDHGCSLRRHPHAGQRRQRFTRADTHSSSGKTTHAERTCCDVQVFGNRRRFVISGEPRDDGGRAVVRQTQPLASRHISIGAHARARSTLTTCRATLRGGSAPHGLSDLLITDVHSLVLVNDLAGDRRRKRVCRRTRSPRPGRSDPGAQQSSLESGPSNNTLRLESRGTPSPRSALARQRRNSERAAPTWVWFGNGGTSAISFNLLLTRGRPVSADRAVTSGGTPRSAPELNADYSDFSPGTLYGCVGALSTAGRTRVRARQQHRLFSRR